MSIDKSEIIANICYTELVYSRINKKLKTNLSVFDIERKILHILEETPLSYFTKIGKNFYISNIENNIKITVNSHTYRVITADKIDKKQITFQKTILH
ncbi:DUF3781 domain-containing protein [Flavobacterium algicola]|uniref:DUF3781 domain-containing protein n=1 Tax=Flavobacterium algicola TaxID=556529 RepID=UPI001EFE4848|nr:DUF3781 domain-containing protein [Flavobacterium algicola]MCG9791553.1 DUF3781 domain-containing protein [Flavobacterium algicola]